MKIRRATRDDIQTISDLSTTTYVDAFGHSFAQEELDERLEKRTVEFYNQIFDKDTILLAEEDNQVVGYIQFGPVTFKMEGVYEDELELQRIYVLANYQGQGIGKALIAAALSDPRLKAAKRVYLDVWEENLGAQKLYKSLGFKEVGNLDGEIIMVRLNEI
jgi:diamine N-acetyltransferase